MVQQLALVMLYSEKKQTNKTTTTTKAGGYTSLDEKMVGETGSTRVCLFSENWR